MSSGKVEGEAEGSLWGVEISSVEGAESSSRASGFVSGTSVLCVVTEAIRERGLKRLTRVFSANGLFLFFFFAVVDLNLA